MNSPGDSTLFKNMLDRLLYDLVLIRQIARHDAIDGVLDLELPCALEIFEMLQNLLPTITSTGNHIVSVDYGNKCQQYGNT